MKITVESNLHISKVFEPPVVLNFEGESLTIKALLSTLAERCKPLQLLGENDLLGHDIDEMAVNDKDFFALKKGVQTLLNDGDRIRLQMQSAQLGGG